MRQGKRKRKTKSLKKVMPNKNVKILFLSCKTESKTWENKKFPGKMETRNFTNLSCIYDGTPALFQMAQSFILSEELANLPVLSEINLDLQVRRGQYGDELVVKNFSLYEK
jgi:hypothetical protein